MALAEFRQFKFKKKTTFLFRSKFLGFGITLCWLDKIYLIDLGRLSYDLADCPLIYAD